MKRILILMAAAIALASPAWAGVHTETVEYRHGDAVLQGYLAYDETLSSPRPAVLVVHDWKGIGESTKKRVQQLAGLGYVAFAADIYGKGKRPANQEEAAATAKIYKDDRKLMRERAAAGLAALLKRPQVDKTRVAAIGYCFGGMAVLELARSGADVNGVVSFHGSLNTPNPDDAQNIKGKVLVLHGADDPFAPAAEVAKLQDEMRKAGVDYQITLYGGAVHSFTEPAAGNDPSKGAAYNEEADKRSWRAMKDFFGEIFA